MSSNELGKAIETADPSAIPKRAISFCSFVT